MPDTFPFLGSPQPLHPHIQHYWFQLCEALPEGEIVSLRDRLNDYLDAVQQALIQNEFLDLRLARQIAHTLHQLLDSYSRYTKEHQSLLVGTVRYFVKDDDAEHDMHSVLGLDDDAAVLNYFLDILGRPELKISL